MAILAARADVAAARAEQSSNLALIAHLKLQIEKLSRDRFGPRSERTARLLDQMELQLEELEAAATEDELAAEAAAVKTATVAGFTRTRPARRPFPEPSRAPGPILETACWAHARRKFFVLADVASNARRAAQGKAQAVLSPICLEAVQRIDALFDIERGVNGHAAGGAPNNPAGLVGATARRAAPVARRAAREDVARQRRRPRHRRRSWLFCGSNRSGQCAAVMYSLIVTAKMNDIDRRPGSPMC